MSLRSHPLLILLCASSGACTATELPPIVLLPEVDGGTPSDAGQRRDAGLAPDATALPGSWVDTGSVYLTECLGFNSQCTGSTDPNCGKCEYRALYDPSKCSTAAPCDNLLLYFAPMGCDSGPMEDTMEQTIKNNSDFLAACAQPLAPGELLPSSLGAPQRENTVIPRVLSLMRDAGWTGKNLLMGGCSAGASRYPSVAGRYPDEQAWMGTAKTAVCLGDGVISVSYQDKFMGEMITQQSCRGRHQRIAKSYTSTNPEDGHACAGSSGLQCGCDPQHTFRSYPGDCAATGGDCVKFDSIIEEGAGGAFAFAPGVTPASFAVPSWKLISDGSAFEGSERRCDQDIAPEAPFAAFCQLLDGDPAHECTHVSVPDQPHCQGYRAAFADECIGWFRSL